MKIFRTISEFHQYIGLPAPLHPLISVIDVESVPHSNRHEPVKLAAEFYAIAVKRMLNLEFKYGQHSFDFNEGVMSFMAPNQVYRVDVADKEKAVQKSGWVIYIHPDFIWNTALAKTIKQYDFWDYSLYEGLFLSEKEEDTILALVKNVDQEYQSNIDQFSKNIIISHLETLLNYSRRFYHRQFITREKANHQILERLETVLNNYLNSDEMLTKRLPTVAYLAGELNISAKYLSSMLKVITGQSTQQYIHEKLIAKAKEKLSTTDLSVSEIAYQLGFEHPQSFTKLFKLKTKLSPVQFRQSFN